MLFLRSQARPAFGRTLALCGSPDNLFLHAPAPELTGWLMTTEKHPRLLQTLHSPIRVTSKQTNEDLAKVAAILLPTMYLPQFQNIPALSQVSLSLSCARHQKAPVSRFLVFGTTYYQNNQRNKSIHPYIPYLCMRAGHVANIASQRITSTYLTYLPTTCLLTYLPTNLGSYPCIVHLITPQLVHPVDPGILYLDRLDRTTKTSNSLTPLQALWPNFLSVC